MKRFLRNVNSFTDSYNIELHTCICITNGKFSFCRYLRNFSVCAHYHWYFPIFSPFCTIFECYLWDILKTRAFRDIPSVLRINSAYSEDSGIGVLEASVRWWKCFSSLTILSLLVRSGTSQRVEDCCSHAQRIRQRNITRPSIDEKPTREPTDIF